MSLKGLDNKMTDLFVRGTYDTIIASLENKNKLEFTLSDLKSNMIFGTSFRICLIVPSKVLFFVSPAPLQV